MVNDACIYLPLPSTIIKERDWNLPHTQEYLLHTLRYGNGEGRAKRLIGDMNAHWRVVDTVMVAGSMGEIIGSETFLTLVVGKYILTGQVVHITYTNWFHLKPN